MSPVNSQIEQESNNIKHITSIFTHSPLYAPYTHKRARTNTPCDELPGTALLKMTAPVVSTPNTAPTPDKILSQLRRTRR